MTAAADSRSEDPLGGRRPALIIALWLGFSAFPVIDFLGSDPSTGRAVVVLALAAAFVATYLQAMLAAPRLPGAEGWAVLVPLLACTAALLAIDGPRWVVMAIFSAAAAGRRLPSRPAIAVIAALGAACAAVILADGGSAGDALSIGLTTIGIGYWALFFTRALVANARLQAAQAEIARLAAADERLRIARDLHDLLGHSLSVVALKSELAGRLLPEHPDEAATQVADIEAVSRRALAEVREAVSGQRRPVLAEEVEGARSALAGAGVEVEVDVPAVALPADAEAVLAWAVREGATNALRHAGARHVRIAVQATGAEARVEVIDDGCGAGDGELDGGTGLAGLAERAARVRGRLDAAPRPGGGFRLAVAVPLELAP